ncbi:MAG: SRPBCC domain-containing protein [Thermanaerothrix sp.]|nr:SRPBCC domain-containing protein [Thermanaerothrix sp.]
MFATIEMMAEVPVYPERVYRACLDDFELAQITRQPARIVPQVGGKLQLFGEKVTGEFRQLVPYNYLEMTWHVQGETLAPDSRVAIRIEPTCVGCLFRVWHHGVQLNRVQEMLRWWEENYLRPLQAYFEELVGDYVADLSEG